MQEGTETPAQRDRWIQAGFNAGLKAAAKKARQYHLERVAREIEKMKLSRK
jgi:hypothetical protein